MENFIHAYILCDSVPGRVENEKHQAEKEFMEVFYFYLSSLFLQDIDWLDCKWILSHL